MIIKIKVKDINPTDVEDWKKMILYTVNHKGYNKNTFKKDFEEVLNDPLAVPDDIMNNYVSFKSYVQNLDTSNNDFLTRAKEAFMSPQKSENKILLIASLYSNWLLDRRKYNLMQGKTFTKEDYKLAAYNVVENNSYNPNDYLMKLSNAIEGNNTRYTHEISEIDEWVKAVLENRIRIDKMSEIDFNSLKVWDKGEIQSNYDKKMLGIAVKTYLFYSKLGKSRPSKDVEEKFTVGDRIVIVPHDFTLLKTWLEERNGYTTIRKYKYSIKYNGMIFSYEGTVTPYQLETCSKMTAGVKNITTSGNSKIITIGNVRTIA